MVVMVEVYVSTDIESDGPIPGINSMLSFGSVAFTRNGTNVGEFSANLETLQGAVQDMGTMNWWKTQPEAWEACRQDLLDPEYAMNEYVAWLKALPGTPVFVGYPAGFDFTFVYWYLIRFTKESPFSFSAIDLKTYAMAILNEGLSPDNRIGYREIGKRSMPKAWFGKTKHNHIAVDDAREQGEMFINMIKWQQNRTNK